MRDPEDVRGSHLFRFHFDVADVRSLVLFAYLSDVEAENGPHVVISGTHRRRRWRDTWRIYLGERAARERCRARVAVITGGRGTAFFEEQTAYHKQMIPAGPHLMLRITYTLWRVPGPSSLLAGSPGVGQTRGRPIAVIRGVRGDGAGDRLERRDRPVPGRVNREWHAARHPPPPASRLRSRTSCHGSVIGVRRSSGQELGVRPDPLSGRA